MEASNMAEGIIFLSQTVVGVLGNSSLLLHYLVLYFMMYRVRPIDLILKQLIVSNLLTLLCKGVPQTVAAFGVKDFVSDVGCKLLFSLHRVGRNVSIGSTCLLSVFQAIKISPGNSRWAKLKVKAPRCIALFLFLFWIMSFLVSVINFMYVTGNRKNKNTTSLKDFGYCSSVRHDKTTDSLYAALGTFPDVLSVVLMLWACNSMVLILYRHKQRMQHIHKASSPRTSPESRATKTILLLVSTFVSFYTLSSIFRGILTVSYNPALFLVNTIVFLDGCFPAISPFLLLSRDSNASRLLFALVQNRKIPDIMMNM